MADQELLLKLVGKGLTDDDLDEVARAVGDSGLGYELDSGRLILMTPMKSWHADVSRRVCGLLIAQRRIAYQEQGVRLGRGSVRFGDVVVFGRHPDPEASIHDPVEIELVAEVVSHDSMRDDRVIKPDLYGAAGIGEYWIVDRRPGTSRDAIIEFFRLGQGGQYRRTGEAVLSELEDKHGTAGR